MTYNTKLISFVMALSMIAGTAHAMNLTRNLSVGSTGSDVSDLQTFLAEDVSIYPEGLITGYFGGLTRSAVIRYQAAHGIAQVGNVGPITRMSINNGLGNGNASYDVHGPILSSAAVTVSKNSATIGWNTNKAATSRVYYSTVWPFLMSSAWQVQDGSFINNHTMLLSNLSPNTTYYFIPESVDNAGNERVTTHKSFTTTQ